MRNSIKIITISLSFANLCFFSVWKILKSPNSQPYYLRDGDSLRIVLAAMIGVLLLALAFCISFWIVGRSRRESLRSLAERLFLLAWIVPLNGVRDSTSIINLPHIMRYITKPVLVIVAVLGTIAAGVVLVKWHRAASRIALAAALISSPFCLVTAFQVSSYFLQSFQVLQCCPQQKSVHQISASPHRILWFVYDEMDQRLIFDERPAGIRLPSFDRFKDESIYVSNAISACRETNEAMPSLITGNIVVDVRPKGSDELMLRYSGQQRYVPWSSESTVFSSAKSLGFRTAVVGWYHPYCRVIGHSLNYCMWLPWEFAADETSVLSWLAYEYQTILPVAAQRLRYFEHRDRFLRIKEAAKRVVLDSTYNLVLVHWPIPHMPYIYDRRTEKHRWNISRDGYFDNVVLADRSFGDIREELESKGLWDASMIVVTSDHFWRNSRLFDSKEDVRVPFIIKMPGKNKGTKYEGQINTIVTRELIEGFMKDRFSTPDEVTCWLATKNHTPN